MDKLKCAKLIVFTLLFYFLSPIIIFLLIIPNYFLRMLTKLLSKLLRKDLTDFVIPLSNLFAVDDLYERPTATLVLVLGAVFENSFTKEFICDLITEKWLNKKCSSGKLIYSEFRKSIQKWLHFCFWKNDQCFQVSNHVKIIDVNEMQLNHRNYQELIVKLINSSFTPGRSPWEVLVINGCDYCANEPLMTKSESTLVVFKIHHSLVDGISILNLSRDLVSNEERDVTSADSVKSSGCQEKPSVYRCAKALLRLPYFVAKSFNEFTILSGSIENKSVTVFNYKSVDTNLLRELKKFYKVSLTSVLLAGFTAAVKYMTTKNEGYVHNADFGFCCAVPVPLPGHPEGLTNHMSFVSIKLPIYEECPRKRLMILHESLEKARNSLDPLSMFYLLQFVGTLPSFLVRSFVRYAPATFLLSNFPGPPAPMTIEGNVCKQLFFNGGLLQGNIRAICACIGQGNSVGITITGEQTVMGNLTSMAFIDIILSEFQILKDFLNATTTEN